MYRTEHRISFSPLKAEVDQLFESILEENQSNSGFVHDLKVVYNHFEKNTLAIIIFQTKAIGFATWSNYKNVGHIDIVAMITEFRGKGFGRLLMGSVLDHMLKAGIHAVYLECTSAESKKFWMGLEFLELPDIAGYSDKNRRTLYKILIEVQGQGELAAPFVLVYPYGSTKEQQWPLCFKQGTTELQLPIITPAGGDWYIEIVNITQSLLPEKVKNFRSGRYLNEPFLMITELR